MDNLSLYFDHTLLKAEATKEQIQLLCSEARELKTHSICVLPTWLPVCRELLRGADVKLCTVVGFPLGGDPTISKAATLDWALKEGCDEFDIMINLGWFKSGNTRYVGDEIKELVAMAEGKTTKIIVESGVMNDQELKILTHLVVDSGADYIKTSSGTAQVGATPDAVKLIRQSLDNSNLKIKASGGIRTADQVAELLGLGVERFGSSETAAIIQEFHKEA